jgi:serine O-acetyltransferase
MDFNDVVEELCRSNGTLVHHTDRVPCNEPLPSLDEVHDIVEGVRSVLFPGFFGSSEVKSETLRYYLGHTLDRVQRRLRHQINCSLAFICSDEECHEQCNDKARQMTATLLERLPQIQRLLATDVRAHYEGDPAARTPDEAIFSYPGIRAITNFRIAHELHLLEVPVLPRMITELAHSATGIDIHPGATIGEHFFIDHGTVGETTIIGERVRIYQGVTLGAKSFPLDENGNPIKGIPRHPIIEDNVIIYSGATILGRVTIGKGSIIGGNVWLTRSVPAGSRVLSQPPSQEAFQDGGGI